MLHDNKATLQLPQRWGRSSITQPSGRATFFFKLFSWRYTELITHPRSVWIFRIQNTTTPSCCLQQCETRLTYFIPSPTPRAWTALHLRMLIFSAEYTLLPRIKIKDELSKTLLWKVSSVKNRSPTAYSREKNHNASVTVISKAKHEKTSRSKWEIYSDFTKTANSASIKHCVSSAQKRSPSNIQTELPLGGDGLLTFYQKGKCNHCASSLDKQN